MSESWHVSPSSSIKSNKLILAKNAPKIGLNNSPISATQNIVLSGIKLVSKGGHKRKAEGKILVEGIDKKSRMNADEDIEVEMETWDKVDIKDKRKHKNRQKDKLVSPQKPGTSNEVDQDKAKVAGNLDGKAEVDTQGNGSLDSSSTSTEDQEEGNTSSKDGGYRKRDIERIIKKSIAASSSMIDSKVEKLDDKMQEHQAELLAKIGDSMKPLLDKVKIIEDRQTSLEKHMDFKHEEMEGKMKEEMVKMKEELKTELRADTNEKKDKAHLAAFHFSLIQQIEQESNRLLVFGLDALDNQGVSTEARQLLESIATKANVKIEVKSVFKISKGPSQNQDKDSSQGQGQGTSQSQGKGAAVVTLGNAYQRNDLLKHGKLIPAGITLDRCTPPLYREAYKKFKKKARVYSRFFGTQTQVVFIAQTMQLRYKENGKAFTILEEYTPSPQDAEKMSKGNKVEGDSVSPSVSINAEAIKEARRFIALAGHQDSSERDLREWLKKLFGDKDFQDIKETEKATKTWKIGFSDEAKARYIVMTYKDKQQEGKAFRATTFDF